VLSSRVRKPSLPTRWMASEWRRRQRPAQAAFRACVRSGRAAAGAPTRSPSRSRARAGPGQPPSLGFAPAGTRGSDCIHIAVRASDTRTCQLPPLARTPRKRAHHAERGEVARRVIGDRSRNDGGSGSRKARPLRSGRRRHAPSRRDRRDLAVVAGQAVARAARAQGATARWRTLAQDRRAASLRSPPGDVATAA